MTSGQSIRADLVFGEAHGRLVLVSAWRPGATVVMNCPPGSTANIALKLARVVFWPIPREIDYELLMSHKDGALVLDRKVA